MKKSKVISAVVGLLALPISLYLTYWILTQLNPDRLIWFLYWMMIPMIIFVSIVQKLIEDN